MKAAALLALLTLTLALPAPSAAIEPSIPQTSPNESAIRAARAENNAALAARDPARLARAYAPGYTFIRGFGGEIGQGPDAPARLLGASDWRDPYFLHYLRTPAAIEFASDGQRAAESGTWEAQWSDPAPVKRRTGRYLAVWVPTAAGWKLRSETFVALGCEGWGCNTPPPEHR